jgi:hypothetical protein
VMQDGVGILHDQPLTNKGEPRRDLDKILANC